MVEKQHSCRISMGWSRPGTLCCCHGPVLLLWRRLLVLFIIAASSSSWAIAEEQHTHDFINLKWAPLAAVPPSQGVSAREPGFLRQLSSWCNSRVLPEGSDVAIERRECNRGGIMFCRRHRRMDSYCLLVLQQHYYAALSMLSFDGKIGLRSGVPLMSIVVPYDGAEVWMEDDDDDDNSQQEQSIKAVVRCMMDPEVASDKVNFVIQRGDHTLMEMPNRQGERYYQQEVPLGLTQEFVTIPLDHKQATSHEPWRIRGLIFNTSTAAWTHVSPWVSFNRMHPDTCTTRTDWESIRVYDVFLFNGEADLLEVRLHELAPVVHTFVIIEFDTTFRGGHKQYQFDKILHGPDRHRFEPFLDQIVYLRYSLDEELLHHGGEGGGPTTSSRHSQEGEEERGGELDPWSYEYLQRDCFAKALSSAGARLGDLVLLLDADELVRREVVHTINKCQGVQLPADLRLDHYLYYNFHWKKRGLSFHGVASFVSLLGLSSSAVVRQLVEGDHNYKGMAQQELQMHAYYVVPDAGWHMSYFMTPQQIAEKLGQFAHSEYDIDRFNRPDAIARRIAQGEDLFGRAESFEFLEPDVLLLPKRRLLPSHVRANLQRFSHFLPHVPTIDHHHHMPLQHCDNTTGTSQEEEEEEGAGEGGEVVVPQPPPFVLPSGGATVVVV